MSYLYVEGRNKLEGEIAVSGSKNSALPVIAASILVPGKVTLRRIPNLTDIHVICKVLDALGAVTQYDVSKRTLTVDASGINKVEAPYTLVEKMRASFLVLGPLLARFGEARVPMPGGCRIGTRSVEPHLNALKDFGPEIFQEKGVVVARGKLKPADIYLDMPSVGATENAIATAAGIPGKSTIYNCAEEPEIVDLAEFLSLCGAKIEGVGTRSITVEGSMDLSPVDYEVIPDRIEAGTLLIAGAATEGFLKVTGLIPDHLTALTDKLIEIGCTLAVTDDSIMIDGPARPKHTSIRTLVYPGFPTDLQPQMMTLLARSSGVSLVTETLYENRFTHVAELNRMGSRITTRANTAIIDPVEEGLTGAPVQAYDIRGGAAMVIAALSASGVTTISGIEYIDRGYECIEEKFRAVGAVMERREGNPVNGELF